MLKLFIELRLIDSLKEKSNVTILLNKTQGEKTFYYRKMTTSSFILYNKTKTF